MQQSDQETQWTINSSSMGDGSMAALRSRSPTSIRAIFLPRSVAARQAEVDLALDAARRAAIVMADLPAHKRSEILQRAATMLRERQDEFARTIAVEAGKALKFARAEVDRAISTFTIAAEEAKRIHGETIPLDAVPQAKATLASGRAGRSASWLRSARSTSRSISSRIKSLPRWPPAMR